MNNEELVDGLVKGEFQARYDLLDLYQDKLVEYLLRFSSLTEMDAEDIATEVLYWLIDNPKRIDLSKSSDGRLAGLMFTMAKNKAIDRMKQQQKALGGKRIISLDANEEKLVASRRDKKQIEALQVNDVYEWQKDQGTPVLFPQEAIDAAGQMIADLNLTDDKLEHLRLRVEEKLLPIECAYFQNISQNVEYVRWHRLMSKIEAAWPDYPALVEYARQNHIVISP